MATDRNLFPNYYPGRLVSDAKTNAALRKELEKLILKDASDRAWRYRNTANHTMRMMTAFDTKTIFYNAAASAPADMAKLFERLARAWQANVTRLREDTIKKALKPVAEGALESINREYANSRTGGHAKSYRVGDDRYSGGRLGRALSSPSMYRVARDGLDFINPGWLDSQAKQWYRLNFGAGYKGRNQTPKARMYRMAPILGVQFPGQIGLDESSYPPDRSFYLPAGFWAYGNGPFSKIERWRPMNKELGDGFFPGNDKHLSSLKRSTTATKQFRKDHPGVNPYRKDRTFSYGIAGSRFLDVGIGYIAHNLPLAYAYVLRQWADEMKRTGKGPFGSKYANLTKTQTNQVARWANAEIKAAGRPGNRRLNLNSALAQAFR